MKTLTVKCPDSLYADLDAYVREGWVRDRGSAVIHLDEIQRA